MGRPTDEELEIAIAEAARLKESGKDVCFMGKTLLNLNYRVQALEHVLEKTKLFLHSGQGGHEHADLLKAMAAADKTNGALTTDDDSPHPW